MYVFMFRVKNTGSGELIVQKLHLSCRCDKNGDGKLSEEEVKEVRKNIPCEFVISSFVSQYS